MVYEVRLDVFEGPLDLLLHLIHRNEVNVTDVPVAVITRQYLETVELMRTLNLEAVGEYLVMASSLTHIKSRMLLPLEDDGSEEEHGLPPREDLVAHLLEYRRYKDAALGLAERSLLDVDSFLHFEPDPGERPEDFQDAAAEVSLEDLIAAFRELIEKRGRNDLIEVKPERITIREMMRRIMDALQSKKVSEFYALFKPAEGKRDLVAMFLALLELARLRMVSMSQDAPMGPLLVSIRADAPSLETAETLERFQGQR